MLPPETNPNYRNNPSVLIRHVVPRKGGEGSSGAALNYDVRHIQIDTGKTFREGVLRWYPRHDVTSLDGIVLSHDHADAILGLDDVRGLQNSADPPTPVLVDSRTMHSLQRVFPYLCGTNGKAGIRHVAALDFRTFTPHEPFTVAGLTMLPIPVVHGEDYMSNGFIFGPAHARTVYISDCSRVPPDTMAVLRRERIALLVVDALLKDRVHPTHFSMAQSVELARELRPLRTLMVGMGSHMEYTATNAELARLRETDGLDVQLARDGLRVEIELEEEDGAAAAAVAAAAAAAAVQ